MKESLHKNSTGIMGLLSIVVVLILIVVALSYAIKNKPELVEEQINKIDAVEKARKVIDRVNDRNEDLLNELND